MKQSLHVGKATGHFQVALFLLMSMLFSTNVMAQPQAISTHPVDRIICENQSTNFIVTASNATAYKWQVNTGGGYVDVVNGGVYAGAATATLSLATVPSSFSGNKYRCVVSGTNPDITSNEANLTVNIPVTINSQPATNESMCRFGTKTLTVNASGTITSYQWYMSDGTTLQPLSNSGFYSGTNTASLTITGIDSGNLGKVFAMKCTINSPCGNANTAPIYLTVNTAPTMTLQPVSTSVCDGFTTQFEVNAVGTNISYQWQVAANGSNVWNNITNNAIYADAQTRVLYVTANGTMNNYRYRCVVSSASCTPDAISNPATLTVDKLVNIVTQPQNTSICVNENGLINVLATGTDLTYQWQVNTGSGYTNVVDGGVYSGATTSSLHFTNIPMSFNNNLYRCMISGKCVSSNKTTEYVQMIVKPAVQATLFPTDKTICSGDSVQFATAATGTGPYVYQWHVGDGTNFVPLTNGGIYDGATTSTLHVNGYTVGATGQTASYFCAITGGCGSSGTPPVYLTIKARPAITQNPVDVTICDGFTAEYSVTATGSDLTYQWQVAGSGSNIWNNIVNNATYADAHTRTLYVVASEALHNYRYRCVVSGYCTPTVTSAPATLMVDRLVAIQRQPIPVSVCPGDNTDFSVIATGTDVTYQWQVNAGAGWTDIVNGGVYSDATTNVLHLTGVPQSYSTNQYRCKVSGKCATSNTITVAAELIVNVPVSVTVQPANRTICSGDTTTLTTAATGTGPLVYQWHIDNGTTFVPLTDGGVYSGVNTASLKISNITAAPNAKTFAYFCSVTGACQSDGTSPVYVTVNAKPAITAQPVNSTICTGFNTSFSTEGTGSNISYQWQIKTGPATWTNLNNGGIYSNVSTKILNITAATIANDGAEYRCVVTGDCSPVAISNTAMLTIETPPAVTMNPVNGVICAGADTSFAVTATGAGLMYQWQMNDNISGWVNITNGGIYSNATTNKLMITAASAAVNGYRYRCVISGNCQAPATSASATLTINTAPGVVTNPANMATCPGANATFSTSATGTALTYQWQVNTGSGYVNVVDGGIYSGATTAMLQLTGATIADNNNKYRCVINGTCTPPATTAEAELTINQVPNISSGPANQVICLNENTTFGVTATGTGVMYQWQVSTTGTLWTNVISSSIYSGVNTATLTITGATNLQNGTMYRCVVSGTCTPSVTSSVASLTVNQPTVISSNPSSATVCPSSNVVFTVGATGTNVSYQWEMSTNSGSTWNNVVNNSVYSGATSANLVASNVQSSYTGNMYRCKVSGICAPTLLTSATAVLTVHTNVVINAEPAANTTICSGGNTSLSVTATGTGAGYQWMINNGSGFVALSNNSNYSGVTTATLNISGITAAPNAKVYLYKCLVTGTCNSVNTITAYVNVQAKPAVTTNPSSITVCENSNNTSFSVTATGSNLTYQWQVNTGSSWTNISNSTNYSGATTRILSIQQALYSMNSYQYRCVVSGSCTPAAISGSATLTVNPLVVPSVSIVPNQNDICAGTSVTFTATPVNGGTSPAYQWRVNNQNVGTNSSTYTTTSFNNNDIVTCQMTSSATCPSALVVISNPVGMVVTANETPTITISSSAGTAVCSGLPVTFTATTTFGGTSPAYQWRVNGVPVGTNASTYTTTGLSDNDVVSCVLTSNYKCLATQVVSSNAITMQVTLSKVATVSISGQSDTTICKGSLVTLYASYNFSGGTPTFEWFRNGSKIQGQTSGTYASSILEDNDVIQCRFISSEACVAPVMSPTLTFDVNTPVAPKVDISVSFNGGNEYKFTAIPTNGGTSPTYQWYINGSLVAYGPTFTYALLKPNDNVSVLMVSNHPCVNAVSATSRNVTTGIVEAQGIFDNLTLYPNPNSGKFTVAGEYDGIGTGKANIMISNAVGQLVYNNNFDIVSGKLNHVVDLNGQLAPGTYIMRIEYDGKQDIRRFNVVQ